MAYKSTWGEGRAEKKRFCGQGGGDGGGDGGSCAGAGGGVVLVLVVQGVGV